MNRKVLNEIQLNECDLSKVQFSEVDFIDTKLRNLDFKEGRLSSINFVFANLNKIDFTKATIFNSIFSESLIENSIFHDSYIANCKFANMLVREKNEADGRDMITCKIKKNEFNFGAFERCSFKQVAFSGNCFWRSRMKKVYFKKCIFFDTDFSGVFMDEVGFEKCDFRNCKNLDKAFFGNKAVFNFCNFYEAGSSKEDINNLIRMMRNLGAEVEKKPGLKKKFKKAFGTVIVPVVAQTILSYATGGTFELGKHTVNHFMPQGNSSSDGNKSGTKQKSQTEN